MRKTLTTGNPLSLILSFSIPLLIGNIFQQCYSMIDTIVVGKFVSVDALAAIGATSSLIFLIIGFINGITNGCFILTAQRYGSKDEQGVRSSFATGIVITMIVTLIFTIVGCLISRPLLSLLNTPSNIIDQANLYILIIYGGSFTTCLYNILACAMRSLGDSRTPLYFLIIASILNVILDLLFTIVFHMGIAGVAYATVISQAISGILCFFYARKHFPLLCIHKEDFHEVKTELHAHLKIALPMAFQFSITSLGFMAVQGALNQFGSNAIAAYTAAGKIEQLVLLPFSTFGITMATFSAQNLGANKISRVRQGVFQCTLLSITIAIIGALLCYVFGEQFISLFISKTHQEVMRLAREYLFVVTPFYSLLAIIFIYRNALQGLGVTLLPMIVGIVELGVRALVSYTLPNFIGFAGICFSSPISWIVASSIIYIRYRMQLHTLQKNPLPKERISVMLCYYIFIV